MKLNQIFTFLFLLLNFGVFAQIKIYSFINLPKDTLESKSLIADLNKFLELSQKPNEENNLVLPEQKIQTFLLLNEMKNIQKSETFKNDYFYKSYLTNFVQISKNQYLVQVSYIGINENEPILKASFSFVANKNNNSFLFSSPLQRNTENWNTTKVDNLTFHYKNSIDNEKVNSYKNLVSKLDEKLNLTKNTTEFYCCENLIEAEKIIGVDYKVDYNGRTNGIRDEYIENNEIIILGNSNADFNHFDEHDLFHNRLSLVIDRSKVN